jgi:hypothetical protein
MAEVVVQIELDSDTGKVLVGMVPQGGEQQLEGGEGEEQAEASYMKPVKDVAEALQVAGDLLQGSTGEQAQAAEAETGFQKGFAKGQPVGPAKSPVA